ncbi:hypothetical protein BCD49_15420 [Pseudofrankia sp. EUN1h]|nr:hypothetical protein BCD49_15420 [Pseudofrankia sp. EUN1h]
MGDGDAPPPTRSRYTEPATITIRRGGRRGAPPAPAGLADDAVLAGTAAARLALSAGSLALLAVGSVAAALGADGPRLGALLAFCLLGPGSAPWAFNRFVRLATRMTLTMVTGFCVLVFVSVAMVETHAWHPIAAFVIVAAASVPAHAAGIRLAMRDLGPQGIGGWLRRQWPGGRSTGQSWPVLCATAGALLCVVSAFTHRHLDPGFYGFVPLIGPLWFVGLALILIAIVLHSGENERDLAIAVLLLTVVLTLTPSLVYDGPRSQSAEKHIDLVQQIRSIHRLDSSVDVYNYWSGFFAAMAWLCDVTGIRDPLGLATFWPSLLGVFRVAALRYLAGKVLDNSYHCWVAVTLAVLADPIGADYFSPQSVGFVVGLAVFGLALTKRHSRTRAGLLLAAGCLLAVTHQLSPYVVGGVLVVLVVFRQARPFWIPALFLGPAVLWALVHWNAVSGFINLGEIGQSQNFKPPSTTNMTGLARLPIVGETVRALCGGVLLLGVAALVTLVRRRRDLAAWAQACCPAVGLVLVAVNPYGNEGIFRAMLFAIPWLALLGASVFPRSRAGLRRLPWFGVSALLTATFLVAAFGLDAVNVIRGGDLRTVRYFQAYGEAHPEEKFFMFSLGPGDLPVSPARSSGSPTGLRVQDLPTPADPEDENLTGSAKMASLTARFVTYVQNQSPGPYELYAVWSPVSSDYGWAYGTDLPDRFAALREAFRASPYWSVTREDDGTVLFRFEPDRFAARAG